jgi:hypothetical protein
LNERLVDVPADDYEKRVERAVTALTAVSRDVWSDLDRDVGGVGWWDGQVDFRRRVVLSEHLQDSLNGAAEALLDAALEAQTHRETMFAENTWLRAVWTRASAAGAVGSEEFIRAMRRDAGAKRRDRQIDSSVTHVVGHLMRSLDCLAAALIVVGAVPRPVRRADWSHAVKLAEQCRDDVVTPNLDDVGTPGRVLQAELFGVVLRDAEFGPTDWLRWLDETRNSRIHRGARTSWLMLHGNKNRADGLLRPFPVHPDLTDVELMGRRPDGSRSDTFDAIRLVKHSEAIVDGCLGSMTRFVAAVADALGRAWSVRRAEPTLLVQRGAQWQDLDRVTELNFPGYGDTPSIIGNELRVPPDLARRLESAHVMDAQRSRWDE